MRLSPGELATRVVDGTSLRLKFLAALAIGSLILLFAAYQVLGMRYDAQTNERIDDRVGELSALVGASVDDDVRLQELVDGVALFDDVQSIAVADLGRGEIVAEAGSTASSALEIAVQDGLPAQNQSPTVEVRPVASGGYLLAIELDRSAIGADLESGMNQALAVFFVGLVLLLALVYLLVTFRVTRPLERLSGPGFGTDGEGDADDLSRRPVDEIARLDRKFQDLIASGPGAPQPAPVPGYVLAETLPDVWVRLDADLNVLESRLEVAGDEQSQPVELGIDHVSDLLSPDIIQYLAESVEMLKPGDDDSFEFAVGVKVYRANLQAKDADFILELSEGPLDVIEQPDPNVAAAAVLGELLESLPVGVVEADSGGIIRYANRGLFGADDAQSLLGRSVVDVLPVPAAEAGRKAMRDARGTGESQSFEVPSDPSRDCTRTENHVVATESDDGTSYFILSIDMPEIVTVESGADVRALEEQLWALELKVSDYEEQVTALSDALEQARFTSEDDTLAAESLINDISSPMTGLLNAISSIGGNEKRKQDRESITTLGAAATALARVLDDQLGTSFMTFSEAPESSRSSRFHLATLLDEIAIEAGARDRLTGSRISAFVQPSLPKWLFGGESDCRTAIHQMIEFARLVSAERPLILAAMQEAGTGKLIQVRFEIQIPPPKLVDDDIAVLRGCISGELPDGDVPSSLRSILEGDDDDFAPLDIELVTINDEATVLRCSASFELAEEVEAEHSWVRGLRTLIIQDATSNDNGIQSALSAFGIMGYVVTSETDLIEALQIAEEYSNPYRLVIADVDTTDLESFVGQLFDGDAPVVLVGKESESAMVGAISAGYSGYIAKPVRQVDLLEVILSTVEPPSHLSGTGEAVTAA